MTLEEGVEGHTLSTPCFAFEVFLRKEFVSYRRATQSNWESCGCCRGWKEGRHRDVYAGQHYVTSARGASEAWQINSSGWPHRAAPRSGHVARQILLSHKT